MRGFADFRFANLTRHVREPKFWLIQAMIVGIAGGHTILEVLEERGDLGAFAEGILHLPAPTNMVPVVLAALWYGVEGGVLTGLGATIIGVPNLFLFHSDQFEWVGEMLAYAGVLVVAVIVAVMAEREAESRRRSEATVRRLETIRDIASVLSDHDEANRLVVAVLNSLTGDGGFRASGFVPTTGLLDGPIVVGEDTALAELAESLHGAPAAEETPASDRVLTAEVVSGTIRLGTLLAAGGPHLESEDVTMLGLVAQELATAIESVLVRSFERSDLQEYARAVTVAQEAERQRIARDLHDETAQSVVVLLRGLARLGDQGDEAVAGEAERLRELGQQTLESIRATVWALRPPLLDDLGIPAAIEAMVQRRSEGGPAAVDVEVAGTPRRLSADIELVAYRTAQEALTNAERHSGGSRVRLGLRFDPDALLVTVEDDGHGFDTRVPRSAGLGITGMRERARIVGGALDIESAPGRGTRVVLTVPTPE